MINSDLALIPHITGEREMLLSNTTVTGEKTSSQILPPITVTITIRLIISRNTTRMNWNMALKINSLKADFTYLLQKHHLDFGAGIIWYGINPGTLIPGSEISPINSVNLKKEQSREMAVYINDEFKVSPGITFMYGLRYSSFQNLGPADVYLYQDNMPKDPALITDTLQYSKGEIVKSYGGLEPRVSIKLGIGPSSSIKLSYNRMRQYISLISNTAAITPIDIWKTSNKHIKTSNRRSDYYRLFSEFRR